MKFAGGNFAHKIVTKSYEDAYKSKNDHDQKPEDVCRKLSSVEVVENYKLSDDDGEYFKSQTAPNHHLLRYQKPEDVIRIFMMKGFMGRQFLDDIIVPVPRVVHSKKNK